MINNSGQKGAKDAICEANRVKEKHKCDSRKRMLEEFTDAYL